LKSTPLFTGIPLKAQSWVGQNIRQKAFVYAAKLPKLITHTKKLEFNEGVKDDLSRFLELMEPLSSNGKLGCILIQLPPKYRYMPNQIEEFLKMLPTNVKFAVEFRDPSWLKEETWTLLKDYDVAYVVVDEPLLPPELHVTCDIAYFRWHGHGNRPWYNYRYRPKELAPWASKLKEVAEKVERIYGYFNNHHHGYAVENCLQVLEMLGALSPRQIEAKLLVKSYFKNRAETPEKLETFIEPVMLNFEALINHFVDAKRLKRERQISDNQVGIQQQDARKIRATIKEYHAVIDLESHVIMHDCADWNRLLTDKRMCKHLAKLFLALDRKQSHRFPARNIL
jgi:uncharacterized protein YecE (DUF72 family)